jgi:predicted house-cleaning noncanonical NTP pyrophosphatase (MazG superfamily)
MRKKLYHKLVRDRIPEILARVDKEYQIAQLQGEELERYALKKLREEVQEFIEDPCAEEAADILEILHFICVTLAIPWREVEAERTSKYIIKGGFDMGTLLEWVED